MTRPDRPAKDTLIRDRLSRLIARGEPGARLPRVRDLMAEFATSQRVVQRAVAPLIADGLIVARPGAGLRIAEAVPAATPDYAGDCLILYRASESRLARMLLIALVARLRKRGHRVEMKGFETEADAMAFLDVVIDGVSVTGIDADIIGTNWREALSIAYRALLDQGHRRIGFLTSSHDARQIAMARSEFLLLSGCRTASDHPRCIKVDALPGSYPKDAILRALPDRAALSPAPVALR
jgi:DNA-binding transcriptional regulator YhcF (GntR family)